MAGGKGSKLLAAVLVGITASVSLYFLLSEPEIRYALSVEQAWREAEHRVGRSLRLTGVLVPGTLKRRAAGCGVDFALQQASDSDRRILVHHDGCALPDTLCDLAPSEPPKADDYLEELSVEGELERRGSELHFVASQVMTKCSGKYWSPLEGPAALCARHRAGFYCPTCEGRGR